MEQLNSGVFGTERGMFYILGGSDGIAASQASSGGAAYHTSSGQAPTDRRLEHTSMRHLHALLDMGFTDTAANQEALKRVEREGIKEQERQVSRAVEILSASS